ncbi:ABC transporter permease [Arthrobacter crystallopoietes]|uniref:ABC transporter permease n=1 Tax=Crystallibacter crystallopoietes TaxID=37928 RepID=UPI0011113DA8|nr:polyketide antibiotic transporter [Arthrobacter crystallopoietes]
MGATLRLAVAQARRDRWQLCIWVLGISVLGLAAATAVGSEFGAEAERAGIIAVAAANPAFLFLRGLPDGAGIGAVVFFQGYAFTAVLAGLMSTFLVIRHTRSEEELGRAELLGSSPIARSAPLAATLLLGVAANVLLSVFTAVGFVAGGLPAAGSAIAGLAVGAAGFFFVAAAAVLAQFLPSGRGANGAAAALVGLAYLLRGIGDALGTAESDLMRVTSAWPSLLSPIGWGQRSRPFTTADPLPLLVPVVAAAVLAVLALRIRHRRDLGASLLPDRAGRARSSAAGRSLVGLAWRLQRATLAGWVLGGAALGTVAGALGPVVSDTVAGNPSLAELIARLVPGSRADVVDVFAAALLGIAGVLGAAAGVQATLRMRAEEAEARAELLLAAPKTRTRWLAANLAVAAFSVTTVSAAAGIAASVALEATGTTTGNGGTMVLAALAHVPAALVFTAVAALIFAVVPRLTVPLGWGLLAAGLVLGQFGELLRLPAWLQNLSPFRHSPALPVEDLDVTAIRAALFLTGAAAVLAAVATGLLNRRDLTD